MRREVEAYAKGMEMILTSNDAEKGDQWKDESDRNLFHELMRQVLSLHKALVQGPVENVRKQAVDVGNVAMMIFDNWGDYDESTSHNRRV